MEIRLSEVLEPLHSLALSHSWSGLTRVIRERPVTGAVVSYRAVPLYPSGERSLVALRSQYPNVPLVLVVERPRNPFVLFRLGKAGIEHLVLLPVDDLGHELARAVGRAEEGGATSFVVRALSRTLPRRELMALQLAMDSVHRRMSAEALATEVGLTRPHLSVRFRDAGLPSVGHLLLWTRLFHAGHWLEEPGRTGESVGRQLEYSSGAAFRRALKLYTGATPSQVRQGGGLRLVFRHFLHRTGLSLAGHGSA